MGIVYDVGSTSTQITGYGGLKGTSSSGTGSRAICARKVCLFDATHHNQLSRAICARNVHHNQLKCKVEKCIDFLRS